MFRSRASQLNSIQYSQKLDILDFHLSSSILKIQIYCTQILNLHQHDPIVNSKISGNPSYIWIVFQQHSKQCIFSSLCINPMYPIGKKLYCFNMALQFERVNKDTIGTLYQYSNIYQTGIVTFVHLHFLIIMKHFLSKCL